MDNFKVQIKQVYDYVQDKKIESFHCIALDNPSKTTLVDFQDHKIIEPILCIELDANKKSYKQDYKVLQEVFTNYEIRILRSGANLCDRILRSGANLCD